MTRTIRTIIIAAMALAAASCAKEITADVSDSRGGNSTESGKITVNVEALMGDLSPAGDETKSSIAPVVRLTWENTDVVYAYDATQCLGSLTVTPVGNGTSAKLSGDITATAASKITLVHCNTADAAPDITDGAISFDLSNQDEEDDPFVVWGTLDNSKQTNITDQVVPFHFATSLMRITATGLDRDIADIDSVKVSGLNTVCKLFVTGGGNPSIGGDSLGTIKKTGADNFIKEDERTIFTVSVAFTQNSDNDSRKIVAFQGIKRFGSAFSKALIDTSKSYISTYALSEADGSRGKINGHDYVCIAGTKWATQNLAVSESGCGNWTPDGMTTVTVPGSTTAEKVIIGDFFQWGASYDGYGKYNLGDDGSLIIYTDFTYSADGDKENDTFTLIPTGEKSSYIFHHQDHFSFVDLDVRLCAISPFLETVSPGDVHGYEYYNMAGMALAPGHDAANLLWGRPWRMPTADESIALFKACFIKWDAENKGFTFYLAKEESHKGKMLGFHPTNGPIKLEYAITDPDHPYSGMFMSYSGDSEAFPDNEVYAPEDALLFFPAAGYGDDIYFEGAGSSGAYWLGELDPYNANQGMTIYFISMKLFPSYGRYRCLGCSIRPVSD